MYHREPAKSPRFIDEFAAGFGWLAHPDEGGQRASHAIHGADGVWILDPVDAPGIDERIADIGPVVGVAVCSSWHARDAGAVADRFDVPVVVPAWMTRVTSRVDAPVIEYTSSFPDAAITLYARRAVPRIREAILFHRPTMTLYVAESLGTTPHHTLPGERLAPPLFSRLLPPTQLAHLAPERILVGHGTGIHEDAPAALADALSRSRRRFPHAVVHQLRPTLRSGLEALQG